MTDWTSGYVADVNYTFGYYGELNPAWAEFALVHAGIVPPEMKTACELGFGQGLSINIHAAASNATWYGTDFNPAQAAFAQDLARASGASAHNYDDAFTEFAQRPDLPDFDYIGLHGIWSWISDENRKVISEFIRRKLKVGGVVYISYNTLPGWSAFAPMRHLMTEHAEVIGSEGRGIVSRINGAVDFATKLIATNPIFARANPQIAERLKGLKTQNPHYLAHEYFNRDWHPMHFATMAEWLEPAKLQFACSAHYLDYVAALNLTPDQQAFLKDIPDNMFRESVRDFMVNQQFRRDYWVRGIRQMPVVDRNSWLKAKKFILVAHRAEISLKAKGALGEAQMTDTVYNPILDVLADHKPKSLGQLESALAGKGPNFVQLLQALVVMAGNGQVAMVQEDALIAQARKRTEKLNDHLMQKALSGGEISYLAAPVTGGGVAVDRFEQLFLHALHHGKKQSPEWAMYAWQVLSIQGQKLIKDDKPLETAEENLAELTAKAQSFAAKRLPILKGLQVA